MTYLYDKIIVRIEPRIFCNVLILNSDTYGMTSAFISHSLCYCREQLAFNYINAYKTDYYFLHQEI